MMIILFAQVLTGSELEIAVSALSLEAVHDETVQPSSSIAFSLD